ncbi:MAG: DnaJ domain-containing protein [Desulfovibrio sp.]|nr:DnaJ domain-containing protein [Desulfovibrio sp.]
MARRARQISLRECYEILHLQKGADLAAVKKAYRQRAFELHPDLNPGDPEASRQFQLLNEAYVALTAMLKPVEDARQKAQAQKQATREEASQQKPGPQQPGSQQSGQSAGQAQAEQRQSEQEKASAAYAEQDVLRDLLNDPFARRVFEDIYSELGKKQAKQATRETPPPPPPPPRDNVEKQPEKAAKPPVQKPGRLWERGQEKGVKGAVKDWLRRQIDEEQTLILPAAHLAPGRRVRLQIRRGLSEETSSIEVTLPPDFAPGKPMRLRGLGRRVGPWQGDLYLTINTA